MFAYGIGISQPRLEEIRQRLKQGQLNALRELLPDRLIERVCCETGHRYRERLLPPLVMVFHYLAAALWPEDSFNAAAQSGGLPVSSGTLSKARQRLPQAVLDRLGSHTSQLAQTFSDEAARSRGFRLVSIDGTCVSMSDQPALRTAFGLANSKHGPSRYPAARLVVAMLAQTGVVLDHRLGPYRTSEQTLGLDLLAALRPGDLLLADAHFAGSNLYFRYLQRGLDFITPVHQRLKVDRLRHLRDFADRSFVAEVPIWKVQRRKYPFLPESLTLRFVPVRLRSRRGRPMTWLVTSLLNGRRYSAELIREWYSRRWPVETIIGQIKQPLSANVLRSKTVDGVHKELAAKIMALNLVRWLMLQAASRHQRQPDRLSFALAQRLAVTYSLRMSQAPVGRLRSLHDEMLDAMARSIVPYRPGRVEPRAIRREPRHYERLKIPRRNWRLQHASSP